MRRHALGVLVLAMLAFSCGGQADDALLAEVAARWECDRQRFTYESVEAIQAAERSTVVDAGLSMEEFEDFKDRLLGDADLRNAVSAAYERYCALSADGEA